MHREGIGKEGKILYNYEQFMYIYTQKIGIGNRKNLDEVLFGLQLVNQLIRIILNKRIIL